MKASKSVANSSSFIARMLSPAISAPIVGVSGVILSDMVTSSVTSSVISSTLTAFDLAWCQRVAAAFVGSGPSFRVRPRSGTNGKTPTSLAPC